MPTAGPSLQVNLPPSREHSSLASPREADSPLKLWKKGNAAGLSNESDHDVLQQLIRTVEKLRRRILGGAATTTSSITGLNPRGVWDPANIGGASPYMTNDMVIVGAGTSSGMYYSLIDNNPSAPDSGYGWYQLSSSTGTWL